MSNPFRWCFIGTGTLAKDVARQLIASGRHEIATVYTRRLENGKAFAEEYGGRACERPEEAISDANVDAVYVVTPHTTHYPYAKLALSLGKPVLCEKPMTINASETEELFALAKEKRLYLAEGMWTWFAPIANQVKTWLDSGEIGELVDVYTNYHLDVQNYAPRLLDPNVAGGALLDSGVYPITYLYRLFGTPVGVRCHGTLRNGVDIGEEVELTFRNGRTFCTSISIVDFNGGESIVIKGTKGTITVPSFHAAESATLSVEGEKPICFSAVGSILNEFDIVAAEIRAGLTESRFVPGQATLDVMHIMDECRSQMGLVYPFEK